MMNKKKAFCKSKPLSILLCAIMLLSIIAPIYTISVNATSTTIYSPEAIQSSGSGIIVSLGDSYSSGEGIPKFYGQDETDIKKEDNPDWLGHRSEHSWPGQLMLDNKLMSKGKDNYWYFAASSGAEAKHLNSSQEKKCGWEGTKHLNPQLDVFDTLENKNLEAEYVTISIGGNDADFSKIITEAVCPHPINPGSLYQKLNDVWYEFYNGDPDADNDYDQTPIRDRLYEAYHDIADAAGPQAKIIVAGYPKLLGEDVDNPLFTEKEVFAINDSVTRFNKEIEAIVNRCRAEGMKICFVSVEEAFSGNEAYTSNPYINPVMFGPRSEDLKYFTAASAYSMHPNKEGAKKYAECVQEKITFIEDNGEEAEWPTLARSEEREVVLVLDTSGSMSGTPMEETIKASENFIKTVLQEDASIGIVTYDNSAMCIADFCMNESYLLNTLQSINSGGSTNIEDGLQQAHTMLNESDAKKKIIVVMSDGEPNIGLSGDSLIQYADTIKEDNIYIYTLGFFSSLYDKTNAQSLLEGIASEGLHYEVDSADDLVFFFGDIAEQIRGTRYQYIRIACPVDVTVKYKGETLSSKDATESQRTDFGTLTFEENPEADEDSKDNRIKILRLKEGVAYDIHIEGNGKGTMDYTVGFVDENGEYSDMRKFTNIKITRKTEIDTVAARTETTLLKVDEDGDGKYDLYYAAKENERGKITDYTFLIFIPIGIIGLCAIILIVIVIVHKVKVYKEKYPNGKPKAVRPREPIATPTDYDIKKRIVQQVPTTTEQAPQTNSPVVNNTNTANKVSNASAAASNVAVNTPNPGYNFCKNCGKEKKADAVFCPHCGVKAK